MRKILLGTTAMAVAGLTAVPALAQLNLTVSGYYRFDAAYVDETGDGTPPGGAPISTRNYDFASRSRLAFDAVGTADNGLKYGARVRFAQSFGSISFDQLDETYGFVQGTFGRVQFGDQVSAGSLLRVYAPDTAGAGGIANGTWNNFTYGNTNAGQRFANGTTGFPGGFSLAWFGNLTQWDDTLFGTADLNNAAYSTRIVYTTTGIDLAGFTFGFSYAPEIGNRGRSYDRNALVSNIPGNLNQQFEDSVSIALQYANESLYNGIGLKAAGQYNHANARLANIEDLQSWMIGAQVSYAGFTLGGHYIDNGDSGAATSNAIANGVGGATSLFGGGVAAVRHTDYQSWGIGLEYATGPWIIGANYFTSWVDGIQSTANPALTQIKEYQLQAYGAGVSYLVAPGLTVGADVVHYQENITQRFTSNPALQENDGTVVSFRTQVDF